MDNYQKVEQLVNKAGCSYEDARAALERSGWDMLDAVISLEREGKVKQETVEQTSQKEDEAAEIIPEVTVETRADTGLFETGTAGNQDYAGSTGNKEETPKPKFRLWNRFKSIMTKNRMVILKSNDQQIVDLPIWIPVIALLAFFWATLILAVIAMVFGCRFHFEGEDLGKTNINNTMDKATDYAEKVKKDLTGKKNE